MATAAVSKPSCELEDALPESYGHSRVVLLAVDPFHVHAYWEMTLPDRIRARELLSPLWENEAPTWVLRFYDVTSVDFDGTNARSHFDIAVTPSARNWYIELWASDRSYFVELGPRCGDEFVAVCRSNVARLPRSEPPPPREPEWHQMPPSPRGEPRAAPPSESNASAGSRQPTATAAQAGDGPETPAASAVAPVVFAPRPPPQPNRMPYPLTLPRIEARSPFPDTRAFEAALRRSPEGQIEPRRSLSFEAARNSHPGYVSGRGSGGRWLRTEEQGGHGGSGA